MNNRKWLKRFFLCLLALGLILALFTIINYTASLELGDKFVENYMKDVISSDHIDGVKGVFIWSKFKKDISLIILVSLFIPIVVYVFTGYFVEKKTKEEVERNCIDTLKSYANKKDIGSESGDDSFVKALYEIGEHYSIVDRYNNKYSVKDDMIANFAHDIKTPLTSVIGFLSLIKNDKDISEKSREKYIDTALEKSLEVEKQLEDLFYISKYDFEHDNKSKKEINLSVFLNHLVDEFYPEFSAVDLKVEIKADESVVILANIEELAKAMGNIMTNAIKYAVRPSTIQIKAEVDGDSLELKISNKAEYISNKDLSMLFNRFYRVDESRNPNIGGSGLGLAISKAIIENMGGIIKADYLDGDFIITANIPKIIC